MKPTPESGIYGLPTLWEVSLILRDRQWYAAHRKRSHDAINQMRHLTDEGREIEALALACDAWNQFIVERSDIRVYFRGLDPDKDENVKRDMEKDARLIPMLQLMRSDHGDEVEAGAVRTRAMNARGLLIDGPPVDSLNYWLYVSAVAGCVESTLDCIRRSPKGTAMDYLLKVHLDQLLVGGRWAPAFNVDDHDSAPYGVWRPNAILMRLFPTTVAQAVRTWLLTAKRLRLDRYLALQVGAYICTRSGWTPRLPDIR
jgi:hypothetical protein